jgi:hypothetical protein
MFHTSHCSLLIRQWVGMNLHALNLDRLLRSALLVHRDSFYRIKSLPPFQHSAKNRVLSIQVRRRRIRDVELAAVGAGSLVGHAQDAASVVSQRDLDLVLEHLAVDRVALFCATRRRRAGLHHEVGNAPVERRAIVASARAQRKEVVGRLWACLAEQFQLDVAGCGLECHRHGCRVAMIPVPRDVRGTRPENEGSAGV